MFKSGKTQKTSSQNENKNYIGFIHYNRRDPVGVYFKFNIFELNDISLIF
jgi:hypothetical protein